MRPITLKKLRIRRYYIQVGANEINPFIVIEVWIRVGRAGLYRGMVFMMGSMLMESRMELGNLCGKMGPFILGNGSIIKSKD